MNVIQDRQHLSHACAASVELDSKIKPLRRRIDKPHEELNCTVCSRYGGNVTNVGQDASHGGDVVLIAMWVTALEYLHHLRQIARVGLQLGRIANRVPEQVHSLGSKSIDAALDVVR